MSLHAENLAYRHGPRFALNGVSLAVMPGMITGLIGPNGAGKTTLIKLLGGLLQPHEGRVILDGKPLPEYTSVERARRIAYVSQVWRPAFDFTVEQTILIGRTPWRSVFGGFEEEEDLRAADEAIGLMALEPLRHETVTTLSGGELQRVMIASALARRASTLLLDEPTTHLDITHQQGVLETLHDVAVAKHLTILASIHDLNLASLYCRRIVAMNDGGIVTDGDRNEVMTPEILSTLFNRSLDVERGRDGPTVRYRRNGDGATDAESTDAEQPPE